MIVKGAYSQVGELDLVLYTSIEQARYLSRQENVDRHFIVNGACAFQKVVGYVESVFGRRLCAGIDLCGHYAQSGQGLGVPCDAIFFGDQHRSTHSIDAVPFGNSTNNPELKGKQVWCLSLT